MQIITCFRGVTRAGGHQGRGPSVVTWWNGPGAGERQDPEKYGFTLIELLIVIAIIGILVTIGLVSFQSSQMRGRDAARKSDLRQIKNALELYYSDYGKYPDVSALSFGGEFTDGKTVYFRLVPKDPSSYNYVYRIVTGSGNQKFQLYAHLENSQDPSCIAGSGGKPDCSNPFGIPAGVSCGTAVCNFSITSSNTTPIEDSGQ